MFGLESLLFGVGRMCLTWGTCVWCGESCVCHKETCVSRSEVYVFGAWDRVCMASGIVCLV